MSRYIAKRAIRGATALVAEAEAMVERRHRRARPRHPGRVHQHRVLPAGRSTPSRARRSRPSATWPTVIERAKSLLHPVPADTMWLPVPGRDPRQRRRHPVRRRGHRGRALRAQAGAADHQARRRRTSTTSASQPATSLAPRRQDEAQRPHRRHPAPRLGHPAGRRPHARLLRHRRLRQEQRGRGQDRP